MVSQPYVDGITDTVSHGIASTLIAGQMAIAARRGGFSTWPPHRLHTASTPARYHARRVIAIKIMASSHTASVSPPPVSAVRITWPMSGGLAPSQAPASTRNHARQFREEAGRGR